MYSDLCENAMNGHGQERYSTMSSTFKNSSHSTRSEIIVILIGYKVVISVSNL